MRLRKVATAAIRLSSSTVRSDAAVMVNSRSTVNGGRRRRSSGPALPATASSWGTLVEKKRFSSMRGPESTTAGSCASAMTLTPSMTVSS